MKLNIISSFDAIFFTSNQQFEMLKNASTIEVDLLDEEVLTLKVYPFASKNLLPFVAVFKNNNGKLQTKSPQIHVWKQDDLSADIEVLSLKLSGFSLEKIVKEKFGQFDVMFLKGENTAVFCVDNQEEVFFHNLNCLILKHNLGQFKTAPFFLAQSENFKVLVLFCPNNNKFKTFNASSITFGEEEITVITQSDNHSGHAKEVKITFDEENGLVVNEELLYVENKPNLATNSSVLPLAFFDALKQKDFSLARIYLAEDLKKSVSNDALEEYFGNFTAVVPYNFNVEKGYYAGIRQENKTKVFAFKVIGGKIAEIEEVKNKM